MTTLHDMMTRMRPMAVLQDGIWQAGEGVWLDINNYKARVILRGKEIICDDKHFLDLDNYSPAAIKMEITRKNISTLPRLPKKILTNRNNIIRRRPFILDGLDWNGNPLVG